MLDLLLVVGQTEEDISNQNTLNSYLINKDKMQTFSATNENVDGNIENSETNFLDAAFREIVKTFSSDGNVLTLEERLQVTELNVQNNNLTSLKGIEYFPNLENLNCSFNKLTQLDASQNSELVKLQCADNQLTSISLNHPKLKELLCFKN